MSSSAARSADRGGGAERRRGWEKESTLQLWQPCRKAASRLTVNPFGSDEPLPLYRAGAAIQGETLPRLMFFYFASFVVEFKVGALQCPPLPRGARIGEVARSAGGVRK